MKVTDYKYALKLSALFRLKTPLTIKTASSEDYLDYMVDRTPEGNLHINGYVWASLFRRCVKRLGKKASVFNLIGKYDGTSGISPFWFEDSFVPLSLTDIRPGIRVERRMGSAAEGALYFEEIVPRGQEVPMNLTLFLSDAEEFENIIKTFSEIFHIINQGIENIGANWSYGYGRLEFVKATYRLLDLRDDGEREMLWLNIQEGESLKPQSPHISTPLIIYQVHARITDGQLMAIHSELPPAPFELGKLPEYPDHFVFRTIVLDKETGEPDSRIVIPGKAIRQALLSVPIERRLRTEGEDICDETTDVCTCKKCRAYRKEQKKKERAPDCTCLRCQWFGSTDKGGIVSVGDAIVENAETEFIRRIQLCEHSMQNVNLFHEEFLINGEFTFHILIDTARAQDEKFQVERLLTLIKDTLDEMKGDSAPPGWYRLGASSTCVGSVSVTDWEQIQYGRG